MRVRVCVCACFFFSKKAHHSVLICIFYFFLILYAVNDIQCLMQINALVKIPIGGTRLFCYYVDQSARTDSGGHYSEKLY